MSKRGGRSKGGGRVVYGIGPVRELLSCGRQTVSCVSIAQQRAGRAQSDRGGKSDAVAEIAEAARAKGIRVEHVDANDLDGMCGSGAVHQGVVASAGPYEYVALEDLIADTPLERKPLVIALDGVTDPHNVGAIARSAYLLGVTGLILPRDRAAEITAVATKASAGATEHLPVAHVTNLARALGELKDAGWWNAALVGGPESRDISELDASLPLCLVVGSEGRGLRQLVAKQCDFQVAIPMAGAAVGSFNVSVAAAIAVYDIVRRRQ